MNTRTCFNAVKGLLVGCMIGLLSTFILIGIFRPQFKFIDHTTSTGQQSMVTQPKSEQVTTNVEKSRMVDLMRCDAEALNGGTGRPWQIGERGTNPTDIISKASPSSTTSGQINLTPRDRGRTIHFDGYGAIGCVQKACQIILTRDGFSERKYLGVDEPDSIRLSIEPSDTVDVLDVW